VAAAERETISGDAAGDQRWYGEWHIVASIGSTIRKNVNAVLRLTIHRRSWFILAGITGTLLVVFVFLVPVLLNADRLRPQAISYLEESTGKKVEIGRLRVTFFPRITIHVDDFGVKSPPLFPPSYILKVTRIDAQIDPWPLLLHRQIVIRSLVLEQPIINLISDPDGPWNFETPGAKNGPHSFLLGVISLVRIKRGHVTASNLLLSDTAGPVFFEVDEVSSELENVNADAIADPASTTLDGQGTLKAAALRFGSIEAKNLTSNIRLQARQVLFTEVNADTYGGSTSGELAIKLSGKNASFSTDARMKQIDVAEFLSAFKNGRGKMTGKMDGELKIAGEIEHSLHPLEKLHGSGHLTVRDGQVPSLKLNANLMKLVHYNDFGPAKNDPSSFNFVSTDLELDHERIVSKVIDIDGYGVDIDGSGSVSISGSDELSYLGVAEIVSEQGVVTNLFARLAGGTLKDGKLSFPFHVSGTIDNPVFAKGK
jgi:uncharacterized protein involved in outer membrane biogenesis